MCKIERRIIEDLMVERIEKNRLIAVSGMSIEELTDAFTKGYRLVSPEAAKDDKPDDLRIVPKNTREQEQEPREDCISRQAVNTLIDELTRAISDERCCISRSRSTATIMRDILHLPPVTPKQKTGRWIAYEVRMPDRTILNYRCSVCGRKLIGYSTETLSEAPFCHCGAKMQKGEE